MMQIKAILKSSKASQYDPGPIKADGELQLQLQHLAPTWARMLCNAI